MSGAGHSGAPLLNKLGVKDGMTGLVIAAEPPQALLRFDGWRRLKTAKTLRGARGGPYDYVHVFSGRVADVLELPKLRDLIRPNGMIWWSWPKRASGAPSEIDGNDVRRMAIEAWLVDIKVCAVDETWSGLKLVIPVKDR